MPHVSSETPTVYATPAERIIESLRLHGPMTACELAGNQGCGAVAIRSQLRNLEAGGLVTRTTERRPIGRPVSRYSLTSRADQHFPKRYDTFSAHLTDAIVREFGEDGLARILQRWEDDLHARFDAALPQDPTERLRALASHQTEQGFMASVRTDEDGVALIERNCPIVAIAAKYPEICRHEAALFGRTLRWKTTLRSCQALGDSVCVFQIGRAPRREAGNGSSSATEPGA